MLRLENLAGGRNNDKKVKSNEFCILRRDVEAIDRLQFGGWDSY